MGEDKINPSLYPKKRILHEFTIACGWNREESPHLRAFNIHTVHKIFFGAQERTRTSNPLRELPPQGSASTNFAT